VSRTDRSGIFYVRKKGAIIMLTQKELDKGFAGGCQNPECKHKHEQLEKIYLTPKCHPEAAVSVSYYPQGFLQVECDACGKVVGDIEVAK